MGRKSKGRQKLEMVKIPKESNLMVTFSKRRSGLFKKASELSTLCGVEVTVIVFSPGKKLFSFGHPCVEQVVNHFLTRNIPQSSGALQLIENHRGARIRQLNMQLTQVLNQLEMEKKVGEEHDRIRKSSQTQCWWVSPIQDLDLEQIEQLKVAYQDLKKKVAKQAEQILIQNTNPPHAFANNSAGGVLPFDPNNGGINNTNMIPNNGFNLGFGNTFY